MSMLNLAVLRETKVHESPYPYAVFDHFIHAEYQTEILANFPEIHQRGSYALSSVNMKPGIFTNLIKELESLELRDIIAEKLNIDLSNRPPLITLRAHSTERDGLIHTDTKSKLITVLIYLNPEWSSHTGKLRVLFDGKNLDPYAAEVEPTFGNCLMFKVTPDCWHGYLPYVGERKSIQLNYVVSASVASKQNLRHAIAAFFKKIFKSNARSTY